MNFVVTEVISIPKIPAALASSTVSNLDPTAVAALIELPPKKVPVREALSDQPKAVIASVSSLRISKTLFSFVI